MKALITGCNGQVGSYMAEYLIRKGYEVHGLARRTAAGEKSFWRLAKVLDNPNFKMIFADITDPIMMETVIRDGQYDEVYNYAAMSHVHASFKEPRLTIEVNAVAVLNLLEAIRKHSPKSKFLQASTSELYGNSKGEKLEDGGYKQDEKTPFDPCSPYSLAKLHAYHNVRLYRTAYNLFAVNSIGFNKESPRRTVDFLTRKVTDYIGKLVNKKIKEKLKLGNINSVRDWSHVTDIVHGHWLMMQHETPDDFVLASGEAHTVKEFLQTAFSYVGLNWEDHVEFDKSLERPAEVHYLRGNYAKAKNLLGWEPHITFENLVKEMVDHDIVINK